MPRVPFAAVGFNSFYLAVYRLFRCQLVVRFDLAQLPLETEGKIEALGRLVAEIVADTHPENLEGDAADIVVDFRKDDVNPNRNHNLGYSHNEVLELRSRKKSDV